MRIGLHTPGHLRLDLGLQLVVVFRPRTVYVLASRRVAASSGTAEKVNDAGCVSAEKRTTGGMRLAERAPPTWLFFPEDEGRQARAIMKCETGSAQMRIPQFWHLWEAKMEDSCQR